MRAAVTGGVGGCAAHGVGCLLGVVRAAVAIEVLDRCWRFTAHGIGCLLGAVYRSVASLVVIGRRVGPASAVVAIARIRTAAVARVGGDGIGIDRVRIGIDRIGAGIRIGIVAAQPCDRAAGLRIVRGCHRLRRWRRFDWWRRRVRNRIGCRRRDRRRRRRWGFDRRWRRVRNRVRWRW